MDVPINYLAVLACGVASMVIGSLWYGPLFGKMWTNMMGWDKKSPAEFENAKKGMTKSYVLAFIGALVMAYVLSHSMVFAASYMKVEMVQAGLSTGFWMWLGFIAPVITGTVLWEGKSWKLWTLNNAYYLVQLLVFGAILGAWTV